MRVVHLMPQELADILRRLPDARIGVLGDFCLDVYWYADMTRSQLSRETPHFPLPVVREQASPGAGGNVLRNLHALGVKSLLPISVLGFDWRGDLLARELEALGGSTAHVHRDAAFTTPAYCKPMRMGYAGQPQEAARLDFINTQAPRRETEEKLLKSLEEVMARVDVLAVCDQLPFGVVTPRIKERLAAFGRQGKRIVVDSRNALLDYRHVTLKPNDLEAAHALGADVNPDAAPLELLPLAQRLYSQALEAPVITLGARGALYFDGAEAIHAPSPEVAQPVDIVGAGDTFLAAFCAALAGGATGGLAAAFANLAAAVSIQKINTTGTATPQEITASFGGHHE